MKKIGFMLLSGAIFLSCIGTPGHAGLCQDALNKCVVSLVTSLRQKTWIACGNCSNACGAVEGNCPFHNDAKLKEAGEKLKGACGVPCSY